MLSFGNSDRKCMLQNDQSKRLLLFKKVKILLTSSVWLLMKTLFFRHAFIFQNIYFSITCFDLQVYSSVCTICALLRVIKIECEHWLPDVNFTNVYVRVFCMIFFGAKNYKAVLRVGKFWSQKILYKKFAHKMLMKLTARCQFHQNFTRSFFIWKCFAQLFANYC